MAYRDDLAALESRCQVLEQDLVPLRAELRGLDEREVRLRTEIVRQRWRIRLRRGLVWMRRHWFLTFLLAASTLGPAGCWVAETGRRLWSEHLAAGVMDRLGCNARLRVESSPPGARVLVDAAPLGKTPLSERICPGTFLVRVLHDRALPWQRTISTPAAGLVRLDAALIPWHPRQRPPQGSVIFATPEDALVFVDGREVGRAPAFVPEGAFRSRRVGLAAAGYQPIVITPRPRSAMYFTLAPRSSDVRR
jgi:hypothetical protein